jgi:hypothetical protein
MYLYIYIYIHTPYIYIIYIHMSVCILYISLDGPCVESCRCRLLPCPGWRLRSRDGVSMYACAHVHICLPTLPLQYPVSSEKITCTCRFKTSKKLYMHMCIYMCVCSSNVGDSKHHETSIANPQTLKSMPLCTRLQRSVPVVPYDLFRRVRSFPGPPRAETKGCGEILGSASAKTRVYMCISYVCTQKIVHVYV